MIGEVYVKENFTLPDEMKFGDAQIIAIFIYSTLFVIGNINNISGLYSLYMVRTQFYVRVVYHKL